MEEIRKFVEGMITTAGVTGAAVPVIRHIMLTITAILLAILVSQDIGSDYPEDNRENGGNLG